MKKKKIIIGSRASKLAIIYAQNVKNKIIDNSDLQDDQIIIKEIIEIIPIPKPQSIINPNTTGDIALANTTIA